MTRIVYQDEAVADVQEAFEWYEGKRPGLGRQFLDQLAVAESDIANAPEAYRVIHRQTRRYLLRRFPYQFLYRVGEEAIVIVGCFHVRRSPRVHRRR